ncbi:NAD(P)-dependent oxidoreductase [Candidatus Acetothermia bacterium]|nr:NAD(P)-dependent oxidoreductase [Candidatus Acetothermia bacterium]
MECKYERLFEELYPPLSKEQAVVEASRCLECGGPYAPAPCLVACPTHIDIPKFIKEIRLGHPQASARTIFESNILGGSCARVCPVEVLCQGACVLHKEGRRPVSIGLLQRYATDAVLTEDVHSLADELEPAHASEKLGRVGVIGAGPAGLSCAAELAKRGYDVTVYEARSDFGGLITYGIAPYKQLRDPVPHEVELIKKLGVKFRTGVLVGRDHTLQQLEKKHDVIFLGIGLGEDTELNVSGSNLRGVWRSLEFIEKLKSGQIDELQIGKQIAVIGGGNTAIDVAREVVRLGGMTQATKPTVMLLYRRSEKEMPAYAHEVRAAKQEGVRFWWLTAPVKLMGYGRVKHLQCIHMKLGEPDVSGRSRVEPVPGSEFTIYVDTVVLAIGQKSQAEFFKKIEGLALEENLVKVNEHYQTTNPKYFAGGDCVNGGATVVEAVQHGKLAAEGIHEYISATTAISSSATAKK